MEGDRHKSKIKEIKEYFEKQGFVCKEKVHVLRETNKPIENKTGEIDLCCQKFNNLSCFEIENGGQFQAVKNARDLEKMGKMARQKRMNYKKCQLGSHESWKEACK